MIKGLAEAQTSSPNEKLLCAMIGCKGRGGSHIEAFPVGRIVKLCTLSMSMGPLLTFDPKKELFTNSAEANKILNREYCKPFVCPAPANV